MKTMRLFITLALVSIVGTIGLNAQGRFGADSANCVSFLNFYKDFFKQNNLKEAAPLWQKAMKSCPPTASQNMLMDGNKIFKYIMRSYKPGTPEYQNCVDSIMILHDLRAEYYPKYAFKAKENKAIDYINLVKDDQKVRDMIAEVISMNANKANSVLFVTYMDRTKDLYIAQKISAEDVLNDYSKYSELFQKKVDADPSDQNKSAYQAFENFFINSGVATCENLVKVFEPRFQANQEDLELAKTIVKVFADRECMNEDLYLSAVVKMHQLEPSYNSAYYLYKLYASKGEEDKAIEMLQEALNYEDIEASKKAELLMELAVYTYKNKLGSAKAVAYAREAMEIDNSHAARANFLIANIWVATSCKGSNDIESRAKYWVATDYLNRAKALDPSVSEEADKLLRQYRQYFPQAADAFMYDLVDGASYSVSCGGLNATTTVRTIK